MKLLQIGKDNAHELLFASDLTRLESHVNRNTKGSEGNVYWIDQATEWYTTITSYLYSNQTEGFSEGVPRETSIIPRPRYTIL